MRWQQTSLAVALAAAAQAGVAAERATVLEEVVVTAQLREESAQETPISLVTMNAEQLEKQRITSITNLNGLVPNLNIDAFPANNQTLRLFIRGVGLSDTQITQDSAVGVYLNGAYMARSAGLAFDVADLERIEVLRGPQGTLYGRNTTGGAIRLITKKPDLEQLLFDQTLSTGNQDLFSSKSSVNIPFGDRYAAKLAYFYQDVDGFVDNKGPGGGFGDRESKGFRFDFRADLHEDVNLDYGFDHSDIQYYNLPAQGVIPRDPAGGSLLSVIGNIAQNYIQYDNNRINTMATTVPLLPTDTTIDGHTLNVDWRASDTTTVRSITAWRELSDKSYLDFASGSTEGFRIDFNEAVLAAQSDDPVVLGVGRPHLTQEQFSQEFQLLGNLSESVDYLAGLYYFYEKGDEDAEPTRHIFSAFPFAGGTIYNLGAEHNRIDNEAVAFFTQVTWTPDLLDRRLHLTAGWRHSEDTRKADREVNDSVVIDQGTHIQPLVPPEVFSASPDNNYDDDSFTFIGEFDVRENLNTYAKYAEAYKSGGYNIRDPEEEAFGEGFKEEKLVSYEVGFKGEMLQRMVRFNSAVFYQEFDDFQYNFQIPGTIAGTRVFNIDNGEMSGVELEVMAMPTAGLFLQASYAYLHSELDDVINPFSGVLEEADFPNSPENTYSLMADYTFSPLEFGVVSVNASYNFVDDRQKNSDTIYRDDYDLINARLSLTEVRGLGGEWTVALWGKNLQDSDYEAFTLDNLPQADRAVIWGEGRTYGLDVTYHYQ